MNFTVYKSSAGSGKTYTLVKEYLKIILRNPADFRNILAVTFTNKAANEMKDRVIENLQELAKPHYDPENKVIKYLLPELLKETELSKELITKNANKSLALILHNYSDFSISTIDSFVHKIIKTFAYDLNLPLNFDVELNADQLLIEAIDILINRVGIDDELTDLLIRFTESKADDESDWHIENDLLSLAKTLLKEDGQFNVSRLKDLNYKHFKDFAKQLKAFIREFKKRIVEQASKAANLISDNQINPNSFYYGKTGIGIYFQRLSKPTNENFKANTRVTKTIEEDIWYGAKVDTAEKAAIDSVKNELLTIYQKIESILEDEYKKFRLYKILFKQIYPLAVLNEIEKIVSDIKAQNNIVHISEFNKQISKIVFSEPIPFIYERLGEKYKHFLIDEFQDTSVLQWQNMIPLIDNSLSEGHFNMIVGDGKQAIYRWRGGEVEQFHRLPEIFNKENLPLSNEREINLKRNYKEKLLTNNFRSKKEIIEFNNDFFRSISGKLDDAFKGIYDGMEQDFDENNTGGYVHLEFVSKSEDKTQEAILPRLKSLIEDIQGSDRNLSDIALLCRTRKDARLCSSYLMENEISVLSSESLLLSASSEINLIISFIQYLLDPFDKIHLAAVIQYLINKKLIDENSLIEAFESINVNGGSLKMQEVQKYFKRYDFRYDPYRLLTLPIYDLLEEIIRIFHFNEKLNPYLQFFLDAALRYSLSGKSNINDFLDWWEIEKEKESVIIPEGIEAIRVLTIHKAKGLEFPVVIYPFASEKVKSGLSHLWLDIDDQDLANLDVAYLPVNKDLGETIYKDKLEHEMAKSLLDLINLLYVAFTRPVEQLYVLTNEVTKSKSDTIDIPRLIKYYLEQKGYWEEEKQIYTFGKMLKSDVKKEIAAQNYKLEKFYSVDWRNDLQISTSAPDIWDVENPERNKDKGNLIHLLLSQIENSDQIEKRVLQNVEKGIIDISSKDEIQEYLNNIILHPDVQPYFEKGLEVKMESEILLESGLTIRPDRLIIDDEQIIIIDYKTGKPLEKHIKQLDRYAETLLQMDYSSVEKVLIYIDEGVIVKKWK